jgi:DNA-binding Xre family transcriptional regulator
MKKRREELGLSWNDIIDGGIANNTWCNLVNGKQLTVKPATMEKLARLLDCTKGDLQSCMAETPNPLRKEAERPEGTAGISIMAKPKKKPKPEAPAPDPKDEEPAEVFQQDAEPEDDEMAFPVYHSVYEEDKQEGEERYKQKLRDMCLRIFSSGLPGVHTMEKIYADIGYALVKELAQGGDKE